MVVSRIVIPPSEDRIKLRATEGGLLKFMRRKIKIHWDRLKFYEDADLVADFINNKVLRDFFTLNKDEIDKIDREMSKRLEEMEKNKETEKKLDEEQIEEIEKVMKDEITFKGN
jgi:hypothetical protein